MPPSRRVIVVTGASAGVGRATARAFAARGDAVALLARGRDGLAATEHELKRAGADVLAVPVDIADATGVDDAASAVEDQLGPIDVWVNNAMVAVLAPVRETSAFDVKRVTEVTYLGFVHGTMSALRRMSPRDRGTIVQVSSALAHTAIPLQASYCAAKHAMKGFTESLRRELLHDGSGIRVTMVALPGLNTPQFSWIKTVLPRHPQPVPPIFQPEVAADAIVWTADHPRREVYVGGRTPLTIWAERLAPGVLDRYLARTNVDAQQTDRPIDADRPDNLLAPLAGDHGAHGIFDDRAVERSLQTQLVTRYRPALTAGLATGMASVAAAFLVRRRR